MEKREDQEENFVDRYNPKNWKDTVFIAGSDILVPKHEEMKPEEMAKWIILMNNKGTFIINLIHRSFPDAYCQIQMSPDSEVYHTFMLHHGPREKHIEEEAVDSIFLKNIFPQVQEKIIEKRAMNK